MDVRLLRRYREMARKKFFIIEERAVYLHGRKELMPNYFLCDNGKKIWNEKKYIYQSSIDFNEAKKMLREQRTRYIEYLVANEKMKRCGKIKTNWCYGKCNT